MSDNEDNEEEVPIVRSSGRGRPPNQAVSAAVTSRVLAEYLPIILELMRLAVVIGRLPEDIRPSPPIEETVVMDWVRLLQRMVAIIDGHGYV